MTLAEKRPLHQPADLPDFDAYPIQHRITVANARGRGVSVRWSDGLQSTYHVYMLRENASDPVTTHPITREQAVQLIDLPEDLTALAAEPDEVGGLWVRWSTGGESRFHPGWLRAYASNAPEDLYALPNRILWDVGLQSNLPVFDGPTVLEGGTEFGRWMIALHVHGVAILEGLADSPDVIETVPARIGQIRPTNFGSVFDVKSKVTADSNAYTSMTLPVHSDLCTREYVPGLQFLHCLRNEAIGGESQLVDGFKLAEYIRETDPDAFDALSSLPVGYYNKAADTDYRWDAPMLQLDDAGNLREVRWSPWLRTPLTLPFEAAERLYRALRVAFRLGEDARFQIQVKLKPGDLLGFDNRRVLHGRNGYDPRTGERWLRGCYVEREELLSRIRINARKLRAELVGGS